MKKCKKCGAKVGFFSGLRDGMCRKCYDESESIYSEVNYSEDDDFIVDLTPLIMASDIVTTDYSSNDIDYSSSYDTSYNLSSSYDSYSSYDSGSYDSSSNCDCGCDCGGCD